MTDLKFNPFEDRLSRDIRNNLSSAFSTAVETGDMGSLEQVVEQYRSQQINQCYISYIEERYSRYEKAIGSIKNGITEPIDRAVVLWNLHLFFEVHEVLEHAWYSATGTYKETLQALIRAAGVYIKSEYGFNESAARIAGKAVLVLEKNQEMLKPFFVPRNLIDALKNIGQVKIPPTLSR